MTLLRVAGVVAGYGRDDQILKGVDLAMNDGEIHAVIGPNGAGKSTLLKTIAGLLHPARGTIHLRETPLGGLAPRAISRLGVAFVPQEQNVFPSMSVRENLEMGGFIDPAATRQRIDSAFARFPLLAERRHRAARTLSGGQRQILAMAMALMVEPALLLLDEPSAGLSPLAAEQLFATILEIRRHGVAIAMVEQNASQALEIADRATLLVDGRVSRDGEAATLRADLEIRRLFLGGASATEDA
jgi:branched-chain amino acid transport system ATP-binding protein/neutral amino acid transport system ATP-binding protein